VCVAVPQSREARDGVNIYGRSTRIGQVYPGEGPGGAAVAEAKARTRRICSGNAGA
jgi:hypothetical protein